MHIFGCFLGGKEKQINISRIAGSTMWRHSLCLLWMVWDCWSWTFLRFALVVTTATPALQEHSLIRCEYSCALDCITVHIAALSGAVSVPPMKRMTTPTQVITTALSTILHASFQLMQLLGWNWKQAEYVPQTSFLNQKYWLRHSNACCSVKLVKNWKDALLLVERF